jgi:hypothetical protein
MTIIDKVKEAIKPTKKPKETSLAAVGNMSLSKETITELNKVFADKYPHVKDDEMGTKMIIKEQEFRNEYMNRKLVWKLKID